MSTIEEIRRRWQEATRGPWHWRGATTSHDVTLSSGIAMRPIVLDFRRWGLHCARPAFRDAARDVIVKPPWVTPESHNPWRITGIDHPDARFIAASWADVRDLLGEIDRRERAATALVAAVRSVASWEEGTGRGDLLEALEDYHRALAGEGVPS